jgi:DNA ligase-1
MVLHDVVAASRRIAETPRRLEKIEILADLLRRAAPEEVPIVVDYLSGNLRQGKIGIGYAALRQAIQKDPAPEATLELREIDAGFASIASITGPGSASERVCRLEALMARAVEEERDFLFRLVIGELRQGSLEGIMVDAIARASGVPAPRLRRALMVSANLAEVGRRSLEAGEAGLADLEVRPLQPLAPMLAQTAGGVGDALEVLGRAALEYKLDGARVQLHKAGDEVRVFSRSSNDVTGSVPELVELARTLPARELVLDGEVIALRPDGSPLPFQVTMRRFGRKLDVAKMRGELQLLPYFFDALYLDGESLLDHPAEERFRALEQAVPAAARIPRLVTEDAAAAAEFARQALSAGHEGIMAKALGAPYEAGSRGKSWLKIKPAHTLDLVILAAEWGHGRRKGRLSNLHLGARDAAGGGFVMLGKTFKGLTDEMLAWQTARLLELEVSRDAWTVWVRPELVVEIAFNDVQASPHYPGGLALRFARVKSYRLDKRADEADTIDTVRAIYRRATGQDPP